MLPMPPIERVVTKRGLHDEDNHDRAYWMSVSAADRVAMVQELRADYHGWDDATGPRMERVVNVVRRGSVTRLQSPMTFKGEQDCRR
jgi:hypothetical protein